MSLPPMETMPRIDADFLGFLDVLDAADRDRLDAARSLFQRDLAPLVPAHWDAGTFPAEAPALLAPLHLVELGNTPSQALVHGLVHLELAKVDLSLSVFLGVHTLLFTGSVRTLGSDEQRERFLPGLRDLSTIGAFALTEPDHGSDISRNMATTATRHGSGWILTGRKRWIGNAPHADHILIWARDTGSGQITGFLVPHDAPGLTITTIGHKTGLRIVQNADIEIAHVVVPEADRLPGAESFRDTNTLLASSRVWVAWQAVALQFAAYECALEYALAREQFGKPIASYQLIQSQLVRMLDNATASLAVMIRIAQLQAEGTLHGAQAALAKAGGSARMRETVAIGRGILGGNGIVTDYGMARIFADAEAAYSYEGSFEMNSLVVGRAITGISAF